MRQVQQFTQLRHHHQDAGPNTNAHSDAQLGCIIVHTDVMSCFKGAAGSIKAKNQVIHGKNGLWRIETNICLSSLQEVQHLSVHVLLFKF